MQVEVAKVVIPEGRKRRLNEGTVAELMKSFQEIGQLQAIVVSSDYRLISGRHRLTAATRLGWTSIEARVAALADLQAELAEIDENLVRNEGTELERADELKRRKEIYEALHPETKAGGDRKSDAAKSERNNFALIPTFSQDTAAKTNTSKRTIEQSVQIATNLEEAIKDEIADTPIADNKTDLLALAKSTPEVQRAAVNRVKSGAARNVRQAIGQVKREEQLEAQKPIELAPNENIVLGDCLKVEWASGIDLIIADPPYGLSSGGTSGARDGKGAWDEMDYPALHQFNEQWLDKAITALKENGSIFVFGSVHNIFSIGHIIKSRGLYIVRDIVWEKPFVQQAMNTNALVPSHELIVWARKGERHTSNLDEITRDVWRIQPEAPFKHKAEKPQKLIEQIIALASNPGDLVADPFIGSGVTPAAAQSLKRRYWGVEQDEYWWKVATSRVGVSEVPAA